MRLALEAANPAGATPKIPPAMLPGGFTLLQVTPALDVGGVETLTVAIASAVVAAGGRSLVASRGGRLEADLARGGGELIRLPVQARNPLTMAANAVRLEGVVRRNKVSLVHVRSRAPAFSALYAARRAGVPVVATYHGIYAARSPLKRWYNSVMTRGDAIIVNSRFTRDHVLAEHGVAPEKLAIIPEGIDLAVFNPAAVARERVDAVRAAWGIDGAETRQIVLVAARLAGWKGHRVVIGAMARGAARHAAILVFVADGETSSYAAELAAEAARAGIDLRLAGSGADMPATLLAADVVAAPSTLPESFGRTVAEACAMERVVVASDLGGPAETIVHGQTGWLAAPGDGEAWAAALTRAMAMGSAERASMGAAARARINNTYSLERMCETTFALYRRLSRS